MDSLHADATMKAVRPSVFPTQVMSAMEALTCFVSVVFTVEA